MDIQLTKGQNSYCLSDLSHSDKQVILKIIGIARAINALPKFPGDVTITGQDGLSIHPEFITGLMPLTKYITIPPAAKCRRGRKTQKIVL